MVFGVITGRVVRQSFIWESKLGLSIVALMKNTRFWRTIVAVTPRPVKDEVTYMMTQICRNTFHFSSPLGTWMAFFELLHESTGNLKARIHTK